MHLWFQRLQLECHKLLSTFAFKLDVRRYFPAEQILHYCSRHGITIIVMGVAVHSLPLIETRVESTYSQRLKRKYDAKI
jgi:hypothetical protein